MKTFTRIAVGGSAVMLAFAGTAFADDAQQRRIDELDQKVKILERKVELQEEAAANAARTAAAGQASDKGFVLKSADGTYELKFTALLHADGRFFLDDDTGSNDTFLVRRARPGLRGKVGSRVSFQLVADLVTSPVLLDGFVDVKLLDLLSVRAGQFKGPVGLERLQSGGAIHFIERAYPTELAPNREVGAQFFGESKTFQYQLAVTNGAVDGRNGVSNPDDGLEYAARVFFLPWAESANVASGLGFGIAASTGDKGGAGATGGNFLPTYRSPAQSNIFSYRSTIVADGAHTRISPQAYWYAGPWSAQAEYITSEQEVLTPGGAVGETTDLENTAWQATVGYVITGENATFGSLRPAAPLGAGGWGAFEVLLRASSLEIDDGAFATDGVGVAIFADPAVSVREASTWQLGFNWHLTANAKLALDYSTTEFDGGAAGGLDRPDEDVLLTRIQLAF